MLQYLQYPASVLTKSKKGKIEVRNLIDKGTFVRYEYLDPKTGNKSENKIKLVLKSKFGREEFFIIPIAGNRFLMLPEKPKAQQAVWNGKNAIKI